MSSRSGWAASLASGALLWAVAALAAGGRELWDIGSYWTMWLPLAFLLCAILGLIFPERCWRWPVAVMLVQLPAVAFAGNSLGLLPLGLIFALLLAVPGMIAAMIGAAARGWVAPGRNSG